MEQSTKVYDSVHSKEEHKSDQETIIFYKLNILFEISAYKPWLVKVNAPEFLNTL